MTEKELVYFLKYHKNIRKSIKVTKQQFYTEMEGKGNNIYQLSLTEQDGIESYDKINNYFHKILEIIVKYERIQENYLDDLEGMFYLLTAEEQCLNTIFTCIYQMKEPERGILILLYIKNEKWESICSGLDISSTQLCRIRKEALTNLIDLYHLSTKKKEKQWIKEGEKFLIREFLKPSDENMTDLEVDWRELKYRLHDKEKEMLQIKKKGDNQKKQMEVYK